MKPFLVTLFLLAACGTRGDDPGCNIWGGCPKKCDSIWGCDSKAECTIWGCPDSGAKDKRNCSFYGTCGDGDSQ